MRTALQNPEKGHWNLTQISRFLKMKNESYAEIVLKDSLTKKFPVKFDRFVPVLSFIADFYCEKAHLVIELGSKTQVLPQEVLFSEEREKELEKKGFKVLKFNNYEIFHDLDRVLSQVDRALKAELGNDLPAKVYS